MTAGGPLAGCVAIVTGASGGIGRDTCVLLARAGAIPVLVGRDATRLRETAAAVVEASGAAPLELPLDVRAEGDMAHMAAATVERHGRIDVLVHAAGILRASGATLRTVGSSRAASGTRSSTRTCAAPFSPTGPCFRRCFGPGAATS